MPVPSCFWPPPPARDFNRWRRWTDLPAVQKDALVILTADVLAAKDVEKAIADRAAWRDDERRWCREGKLPKPGWWE